MTRYKRKLNFRVGAWLSLAQIDLEVSLDFPELYKKDVSKVISRLNRIEKLAKRRRISL